jgi:pSer/pThr/pTyr-binding forkhead associated (FHA) protein
VIERITVGRGDRGDVTVDDPYVSPVHFSVAMREGTMWVRDEGSTNGVFIDSRYTKVVGEQPLWPESTIRFGHTEMTGAQLLDAIRSR